MVIRTLGTRAQRSALNAGRRQLETDVALTERLVGVWYGSDFTVTVGIRAPNGYGPILRFFMSLSLFEHESRGVLARINVAPCDKNRSQLPVVPL